jgi:hypothetical protein
VNVAQDRLAHNLIDRVSSLRPLWRAPYGHGRAELGGGTENPAEAHSWIVESKSSWRNVYESISHVGSEEGNTAWDYIISELDDRW